MRALTTPLQPHIRRPRPALGIAAVAAIAAGLVAGSAAAQNQDRQNRNYQADPDQFDPAWWNENFADDAYASGFHEDENVRNRQNQGWFEDDNDDWFNDDQTADDGWFDDDEATAGAEAGDDYGYEYDTEIDDDFAWDWDPTGEYVEGFESETGVYDLYGDRRGALDEELDTFTEVYDTEDVYGSQYGRYGYEGTLPGDVGATGRTYAYDAQDNFWDLDYGYTYETPEYSARPGTPGAPAYYEGIDTGIADRDRGVYDYDREPRLDATRTAGAVFINGTVEDFAAVNLAGLPDRYAVVRLRLQDGRTVVVNLGPERTVQQLNLNAGDEVAVLGRRGTINDRNVLMAQRIRVGDRTFDVNLPRAAGPTGDHTLRGQLADFARVSLQGERQQHVVARLRLENGRSALVNFGPGAAFRRLNLTAGDRVVVSGQRTSIANRPVLKAEQVRVGNETYRTPRQMPRQTADRRQTQRFRGNVTAANPVRITTLPGDHVVMRVRFADGTTRLVNFGPNVNANELNLGQGDRLEALGTPMNVQGREVFFARQARIGNERFNLVRAGANAGGNR